MRSEGYVKVYEDKPEMKKTSSSSKSEKTPEEIEIEVAAILARAKAPGDKITHVQIFSQSQSHKYTQSFHFFFRNVPLCCIFPAPIFALTYHYLLIFNVSSSVYNSIFKSQG